MLVCAPNLGWRGLDLTAFSEQLGLPLRIGNEATLAARAQARVAGPNPADRSFVYLSAEAGIGAGLVIDGSVLTGSHGWAGELGHVTVDPAGPDCTCGSRGCLETYAGRRAIARAAGLEESAGPQAVLASLRDQDQATAFVRSVVSPLATALASALNLIDVDQVVLGGDYAVLAPVLAEPLRTALAERALATRWGGSEVTVRAARAGARPAVAGAAWSVLEAVLANPVPFVQPV
jgi:predicted NBD/HSP70 family sugar kinase